MGPAAPACHSTILHVFHQSVVACDVVGVWRRRYGDDGVVEMVAGAWLLQCVVGGKPFKCTC